jgi:hypothetical protein
MAALIQHSGRQRAAMVFAILTLALYIVPAPGYLGASYYSQVIAVTLAFGAFIGLLGWAAWATGHGPLAVVWRAVSRRPASASASSGRAVSSVE